MLRPAWVLVGAILATSAADARFGKRSSSSEEEQRKDERTDGAHAAAPVDPEIPTYRVAYAPAHRGRYVTYALVPAPPAEVAEPAGAPEHEAPAVRVALGAEGQGHRGGVTLGVLGSIEGSRWGVTLSGADIIVAADDGSGGIDQIGQASARLTFAFLSGGRGRLRLEAGADAFFAPDAIFLGPTGGVSGVLWVAGPLGIEGAVLVTPYPFFQLDARAGLALGFGQFGVRAGWRVQALNDTGLVDGIAHGDVFNGPYVGVSFVF